MKPILFNTEMVQALLNTKPNTYPAEPIDVNKPYKATEIRLIKEYPCVVNLAPVFNEHTLKTELHIIKWQVLLNREDIMPEPKWGKGDVLFVQEEFRYVDFNPADKTVSVQYKDSACRIAMFDSSKDFDKACIDCVKKKGAFITAVFMPKEASRIHVKLRSVHVKKFDRINERDFKETGLTPKEYVDDYGVNVLSYKAVFWDKYKSLFDNIKALSIERNREKDCYVWIYEFERVEL